MSNAEKEELYEDKEANFLIPPDAVAITVNYWGDEGMHIDGYYHDKASVDNQRGHYGYEVYRLTGQASDWEIEKLLEQMREED